MTSPQLAIKDMKLKAPVSAQKPKFGTVAYLATVYVDGKSFCRVKNSGNGAGNRYVPLEGGDANDLRTSICEVAGRLSQRLADDFEVALRTNKAAGVVIETLGIDAWEAKDGAGLRRCTPVEAFDEAVRPVANLVVLRHRFRELCNTRVIFLPWIGNDIRESSLAASASQLKAWLDDPELPTKLGAWKILNHMPLEEAFENFVIRASD